MATGRETQLTRQIGEHLVVAELGRRGFIATPFAGNVPDFDLLAADERGRSIPIQVKAIRGPSWQFIATKFLRVDVVDGVQHVRGVQQLARPRLVCIFLLLGEKAGDDAVYLFSQRDLQQILSETYKGGVRPKNPNSMHCAVWPRHLEPFKDSWHLLDRAFADSASV